MLPGEVQDGRLFGIVRFVANSAAGDNLVAIHASSIMYGAEGGLEIDYARHAALHMNTTPLGRGDRPDVALAGQHCAIKVLRWINWRRRNAAAVARVSGATYGTGA